MKLINNLFLNSIVVLMLLMTSARVVKADVLPPSPQNIAISTSFDKAASPATLYIWNNASGGYDSGNNARWGLNYWTCTSDSDPAPGKCSTKKYQSGWDTKIALEFVEQRSRATQVLNLYAVRTGEWVPTAVCGGDGGKYADQKPMNTSAQNTCRGQTTAGVSLIVRIDPAELKKIPVGGIWKAGLKIILHNSSDSERYDWQADITLNVTDNNNQKIYLPEFGEAQPQIDLNLRPLPGTTASQSKMRGTANIDMCLYDGYGANSSSFMLNFQDTGPDSGRNSNLFSVYREGGNPQNEQDRIDYTLSLRSPVSNADININRGEDVTLSNINQAQIRQVHLPGILQPVICVPAPLKLQTPEFNISSKAAGRYSGTLRINFTPQL